MKRTANLQTLKDSEGKIAFVVIPLAEYLRLSRKAEGTIPHEVISKTVDGDCTPMKAWREYLGLSQTDVAHLMKVSQPAYAQMETSRRPRKGSIEKVAKAMDLNPTQLDW